MNMHAGLPIVHMISVLLICTGCPLFAVDRIVLDDGTAIDTTVVSQTKDSVTYMQNGTNAVVEKGRIRKLELDVNIDKFYLAAVAEGDTDKKIMYLIRSIEQFPDSERSRTMLARLYLLRNETAKADALLRGKRGDMYSLERGMAAVKAGRPRAAIRSISEADERRLDAKQAVDRAVGLSLALALSGDFSGARAALDRYAERKAEVAQSFREFSGDQPIAPYVRTLAAMDDARRKNLPAATNELLRFVLPAGADTAEAVRRLAMDEQEHMRRFGISLEAGGGNLLTVLFDGRIAGPFGAGVSAGFDHWREVISNVTVLQTLMHCSVYGSWRIIGSPGDVFSIDTRLHAGYSLLYLAPPYDSLTHAAEITPSVSAGAYNVYAVVSCIVLFPLNGSPALLPQLGIGYRFDF